MARKRRPSMLEYMIRRVGVRRARDVASFMSAWALVESELGREPTAEEYASWWKVSAATAYREQALFREVFPHYATPSELNRAIVAQTRRGDLVGISQARVTIR